MQRRIPQQRVLPLSMLVLVLVLSLTSVVAARQDVSVQPNATGTYTNPLDPVIPGGGIVESCADPSVIKGQLGDPNWYMFCTTDPLNDEDRNAEGGLNFRPIPMLKSIDLVNWTYVDDAFDRPGPDADPARPLPAWAEPTAGFWAPEITFFNNRYYLYYVVTDVKPEVSGAPDCNGDSAIGVATSSSPTGPWSHHGQPVIEPRYNGDPALPFGSRQCNFFWTFDPEVIQEELDDYGQGQRYIYYGSYYGGIQVRKLSADGFTAAPETAVQITIPNRYEAPEVILRDGYYYLFVSAGNCCNIELTGYSVFAGRSQSPLGPFVDKEGVSLLAPRVGGTPVLSMNGNRWVGPGHNTVFQDFDGQWWTIYHAVDRTDPYFEGERFFTKRPALLDPVDWIDGWPTVRGGFWISDEPMPAPAAQPGDETDYEPRRWRMDRPGRLLAEYSDEFGGNGLDTSQWSWVRQPDPATYGVENGTFRFDTQAADLYQENNSASLLTEDAPEGDYIVETKVRLNLPAEGCCFNFVQAGLVIYGGDDSYVRLMHVSIFETRQTEFAKEAVLPDVGPRFGGTLVGPPAETTWLRIVKRTVGDEEHYTPYTSRDGETWVRGGTWTHNLGDNARIALASMGGTGFTANFDYVRVYSLRHEVFLPTLRR